MHTPQSITELQCRLAPPFTAAREHDYLSSGICVRCGQRKPGFRRPSANTAKVHLTSSVDQLPVCTQHDSAANTRDIGKWKVTSVRTDVTCKTCRRFADRLR